MEVLFDDDRLRRSLSTRSRLVAKYGDCLANRITQRLQELTAAATLDDMRALPGRCHELTGDRQGHLSVRLDDRHRLLFRPASNPPPARPDGGLEWSAMTAVVVTEIVDYH